MNSSCITARQQHSVHSTRRRGKENTNRSTENTHGRVDYVARYEPYSNLRIPATSSNSFNISSHFHNNSTPLMMENYNYGSRSKVMVGCSKGFRQSLPYSRPLPPPQLHVMIPNNNNTCIQMYSHFRNNNRSSVMM